MTFTERRQRRTDTSGVLLLLEISCPSFSGTLRLVNDTQNWVSNGNEYIGFPFQIKLPNDQSGQATTMEIVLDNVGRNMTEELERYVPSDIVSARVLVTDRADVNAINRVIPVPVARVSVNSRTATMTAGSDQEDRQQAVRLRATAFVMPGIF